MEGRREASSKKSSLRHVWVIRTTSGRIACISGSVEEAERYAKSLVEGTNATYEIIT